MGEQSCMIITPTVFPVGRDHRPRDYCTRGIYKMYITRSGCGASATGSIGDEVAERIGVVAEPEITERQLTAASRYIILASDGVFEFIPSQKVLDIVCGFDDIQEAALAVVVESYKMWLQFEVRTDDITCIVIQVSGLADHPEKRDQRMSLRQSQKMSLKDSERGVGESGESGIEQHAPDGAPAVRQRPVRMVTERLILIKGRQSVIESGIFGAGKGQGVGSEGEGRDGVGAPWAGPPADQLPKTPEELEDIASAVANNFLYSHLDADTRRLLFEAMTRRAVCAGETIIRQGDRGDHFYVIEQGVFDVYINGVDGAEWTGGGGDSDGTRAGDGGEDEDGVKPGVGLGDKIFTYHVTGRTEKAASGISRNSGAPAGGEKEADLTSQLLIPTKTKKPSFGELALMYDKPRSATVLATADGSLWVLHRDAFKAIMMRLGDDVGSRQAARRVLRAVDVLSALHSGQLTRLGDALVEKTFQDGETIVRQGDAAEEFFVVVDTCNVVAGNVGDVVAGHVVCTVRRHADKEEEESKEVMRLTAGDFFGERALLANCKVLQTARAAGGAVTVMCITRAGFEEVLGTLQHINNTDRKFRERNAAHREIERGRQSWCSGEVMLPRLSTSADSGDLMTSPRLSLRIGAGDLMPLGEGGDLAASVSETVHSLEEYPSPSSRSPLVCGSDGARGSLPASPVLPTEGRDNKGGDGDAARCLSPDSSLGAYGSPVDSPDGTHRRRALHQFTVADVTTTDVLYTTSVSQLCLANHVPRTRRWRASVGASASHASAAGSGAEDDGPRLRLSMSYKPSSSLTDWADDTERPPAPSQVITVKQYSLALASAAGAGGGGGGKRR